MSTQGRGEGGLNRGIVGVERVEIGVAIIRTHWLTCNSLNSSSKKQFHTYSSRMGMTSMPFFRFPDSTLNGCSTLRIRVEKEKIPGKLWIFPNKRQGNIIRVEKRQKLLVEVTLEKG